MPRNDRFAFIPNSAAVIERLKRTVMVFDGIVDGPVSPKRIDLVLVPAAKVIGVSQYEPVGQGRPSANESGPGVIRYDMFRPSQLIADAARPQGIDVVAVEQSGGGVQGAIGIQVLLVVGAFEALVIVQRGDQRVGAIEFRRRTFIFEPFDS